MNKEKSGHQGATKVGKTELHTEPSAAASKIISRGARVVSPPDNFDTPSRGSVRQSC